MYVTIKIKCIIVPWGNGCENLDKKSIIKARNPITKLICISLIFNICFILYTPVCYFCFKVIFKLFYKHSSIREEMNSGVNGS